MILTEYNEKEHLEHVANYNKEQGRQQGIEQGRREQNEIDLKALTKNLIKENPSLSENAARERALQLLELKEES